MWLKPGQSSRSFTFPSGLTGLSDQAMRCHLAYYEDISETVRQQTALTAFPEWQAGSETGFIEHWNCQPDCQQHQHHRDLTCILLHELYFETLAPGHRAIPGRKAASLMK